VREGSKTLIAALVALPLAATLAACGGDDSSSSSTAVDTGGQAQAAKNGDPKSDGGNGSPTRAPARESPVSGTQSDGPDDFVSKQHDDSGGGAQQFRVKGGDNSVQDFGEEAGASEREAAATALHNFLDARAEANWAAACEYMSKVTIESLQGPGAGKDAGDANCGEALEELINPAAKQSMKAEAVKADVGSLRMEGERSFVIYSSIKGLILAMPMTNEGGTWKVSSIAGTPLN
jgi:hypothetical protein